MSRFFNNRLKKIQLLYLTKLVDLQLAYNEFESIVNVNSSSLRFLILKFNKIKRIEANAFNGLLKLRKINLLNNSINKIDSNAFNNSYFKES
jgi:Leucine-rich repeat (LRR) protein